MGFQHRTVSCFRRFGPAQTIAPDVHERVEVAAIGGFERGEIRRATGSGIGFENDPRKIQPPENFAKKQADGATIEVAERMDGQEAAFDKGEQFEGKVRKSRGRLRPAGLKVEGVIAHPQWNVVRRWRLEIADADFNGTPTSGPIRHEVTANAGVQIEEEGFVEQATGECFAVEIGLGGGDALGEQRR